MTKFLLHRLVRNKIPDIMKANKVNPTVRSLENEEYFKALKERLLNEVEEMQSPNESKVLSSLATLSEVIKAMAKYSGVNEDQIETERKRKVEESGDYSLGFYVDEVETSDPIQVEYYKERKYKEIK